MNTVTAMRALQSAARKTGPCRSDFGVPTLLKATRKNRFRERERWTIRSFQRELSAGRKAQLDEEMSYKNKRVLIYAMSIIIGTIGVTYASVPLYKMVCTAWKSLSCSIAAYLAAFLVADSEKAKKIRPVAGSRTIRVSFNSDVADTLPWRFRPQQRDVKVVPGETALAFYTASNQSKTNITGVATYNVFPSKAGLYFNKIQCFCFEQQRLRAGEEVDMPVFFFIDPEFLEDPAMNGVNNIMLSYTFFKTDEDTEGLAEEEAENAA